MNASKQSGIWLEDRPVKLGCYLVALENTRRNEKWISPVEITSEGLFHMAPDDNPPISWGSHIVIHGWMPFPAFPKVKQPATH